MGNENKKMQFTAFLVLLLVVAGLTILFATGKLRFGLEGPFIYLIYIFAGLLAAALCYGVLDSTGVVEGNPHGITIKLGGAIVAMVVVAGGGGLYEKYVRTNPFNVRVTLYEKTEGEPTPVSGSLSLNLGAKAESVGIDSQGSALFQDIERRWANQTARIRLQSVGYELASSDSTITLTPDSTVYLKVRKKAPFTPAQDASVTLQLVDAQSWKLPSRAFRTLDLQLTAVSESERDVPIAAKGVFRITRRGVPVKEIPLDVSGGLVQTGAVLQPGVPTKLVATGQLTRDELELLDTSFEAEVAVRYNGGQGKEFTSDSFEFSRSSIRMEGA